MLFQGISLTFVTITGIERFARRQINLERCFPATQNRRKGCQGDWSVAGNSNSVLQRSATTSRGERVGKQRLGTSYLTCMDIVAHSKFESQVSVFRVKITGVCLLMPGRIRHSSSEQVGGPKSTLRSTHIEYRCICNESPLAGAAEQLGQLCGVRMALWTSVQRGSWSSPAAGRENGVQGPPS
ncbi:hypothetical protein M8818_006081 [Zalaria obscura]|uniref:Uncharacterized protein n=1 Tax=Zalaria obscura TaxID=2024903 RepID=A0ACC3S7I4_9PEZI